MNNDRRIAFLIVGLMILPGCMGDDKEEDFEEDISCEDDPWQSGCLEDYVSEDDCLISEIFTGENCRTMLKPKKLDFGEDSIEVVVNEEIQTLTPSFEGDSPSKWVVNPEFPPGIEMDPDTGVIHGTPTDPTSGIFHTIIASNYAGSASFLVKVVVLPVSVQSITFQITSLQCTVGEICSTPSPAVIGGDVDDWHSEPPLPLGFSISNNGSITGSPESAGDSNHTIFGSNEGGSASSEIRIVAMSQPPKSIDYGSEEFTLTLGEYTSIEPSQTIGEEITWEIFPTLPEGLILDGGGRIRGVPGEIMSSKNFTISATNSGGFAEVEISLRIVDLPVHSLDYTPSRFDLTVGEKIESISPTWGGGFPTSWEVSPRLPSGFQFDYSSGTISGTASNLQGWTNHVIWGNNSGGFDSFIVTFRVKDTAPSEISWSEDFFPLRANESANIPIIYSGSGIDSWEVYPDLPNGLLLLQDGSISGVPIHRTDWSEYTIWANNTGGSFSNNITIAVHDLVADQRDLLRGFGETNWEGWPSPILPIGEWAFPVGFTQEGYGSTIPVISASHVGKGKMLGYGHEGWVDGAGEEEIEFALRAVEWVCGENSRIGLAYGAGFDEFGEVLENEGHTVNVSVTPDDLSSIDCLLDEFWNGHDDEDNEEIIDFLIRGGGLIMGGHAWYWSYYNSDVAHNYPGNKISKTTGLFVSNAWGYNDVDLGDFPHELTRPHAAIEAIWSDRMMNESLSEEEAVIADETISICTWIVSLDFHDFWGPLREVVNDTGWTVIEYGTLWEDVGYNIGEDPVADSLLRVEAALTLGLPASELTAHPSHIEFPGEVPSNASRITRTVSIDGNQSGLPSNFGYSSARAHIRMTTGLYAAPGEVVTVSFPSEIVDSGTYILVGAHSDNLWGKEQLHRHPQIVRWWQVTDQVMEVGNAFGGPIYVGIEAGSILGEFEIEISNAIKAPRYIHGETNLFQWLEQFRHDPAPWAEIGSSSFILTVPSHDIRELENPEELMEWWNQALQMEHDIYGFLPWPRVERAVFDAQISAGWMHSGYPFMAHDLSSPGVLNLTYMSENGDWGMFHELGHNHQWMPSTLPGTTETSCNFASVYLMEDLVGSDGHGAVDPSQRNSRMRSYFDDGSNIANWSVWIALDTYLIVKEEWGWGPITEALSKYYTLPDPEVPVTDVEKFNSWVIHLSNATGFNLAPYHSAWGFPINQETLDALDHLPVWIDDPLRGEFHIYPAVLRNLEVSEVTANSTMIVWETYDNGTDTSLAIYFGTSDGGNQASAWSDSLTIGGTEVGNQSHSIEDLECCGTTYYARIKSTNGGVESWFGPVSWTTDYLPD